MVALGFEPRHLSVMGLESIALDHSAKLPSCLFYFGRSILYKNPHFHMNEFFYPIKCSFLI